MKNSPYIFGADISKKDDVCTVIVGKMNSDNTIEIAAMFSGDTTKESLESANKFIAGIIAGDFKKKQCPACNGTKLVRRGLTSERPDTECIYCKEWAMIGVGDERS